MLGRVLVLSTLLLTASLAGCLGQEADVGQEGPQQTAVTSQGTGGLQGIVTDNAIQPIEGANVTLQETNETVRTASDGSYAFSNVAPGSYTVVVRAAGFVSTTDTTDVVSGEVAVLDFLVTHLDSKEAYTQQFELVGFFECGFEVGWNVTDDVPVGTPVYDARYFFLGLAACAAGDNVTNDKFSHFFDAEAPLHSIVFEMEWDASSQFSEWMTVSMNVRGVDPNDNIGRFMRLQGPSPIQHRMDKGLWDDLAANFTQQCEEDNDTYCGYNFRDNGWPLQTRVFPAWQCFSEKGGGCAALQQEFTHYVTAFYNGAAPEGYSVLEPS